MHKRNIQLDSTVTHVLSFIIDNENILEAVARAYPKLSEILKTKIDLKNRNKSPLTRNNLQYKFSNGEKRSLPKQKPYK